MKQIMFIAFALALSSCASKQVLVRDCEQQGSSQYYHCSKARLDW